MKKEKKEKYQAEFIRTFLMTEKDRLTEELQAEEKCAAWIDEKLQDIKKRLKKTEKCLQLIGKGKSNDITTMAVKGLKAAYARANLRGKKSKPI